MVRSCLAESPNSTDCVYPKSAKVARRGATRPEQVSFEVTGPEPMVDAAREAVAAQLPEAKASDCGRR